MHFNLRTRHVLACLLLLRYLHGSSGESQCDANGVCEMPAPSADDAQCGLPKAFCDKSSASKSSIYSHGGTAQSYKANVPVSTAVCDANEYASSTVRSASWPFSRSSVGSSPPRVTLKINLWSCADASTDGDSCCCQPLQETEDAQVEVWQARPDGTYSSLRPGREQGDCRAVSSTSSSLVFQTVAPGSTGSLGGLGPGAWEFMPYGPPVIHFLVSSAGHAPTLIDFPMLLDHKTLAARLFRWPDWRGPAWTKHKDQNPPYKVVSWKGDAKKSKIEIELDIYLLGQDDAETSGRSSSLCPSWLHSSPSSFFLEPISECAPSMLDFFAL